MLATDEIQALNIALNEAELLAVTPTAEDRVVEIWVSALVLDVKGAEFEDPRFMLRLRGVSRVAASLRAGWWDDEEAEVSQFGFGELASVVGGFGGRPIYGWDFIDPEEDTWSHWRDRLSLDVTWDDVVAPHVIDLFQEGDHSHLDLRVWFTGLAVFGPTGDAVDLAEWDRCARRWWRAMQAGDPATGGRGIVALAPDRRSRWRRWFRRR